MRALLEQAGVEPADIVVFSSDGAAPGLDLATREPDVPPDFWLLPQRIDALLRSPVVLVDSRLDGSVLRPARREALEQWFQTDAARLAPGDALLLYVTDHGERKGDPPESSITLWGEQLGVSELRDMLRLVPHGVRVVLLMSQCFSGGFADVVLGTGVDALPDGRVCGYFSTTAERRAHGCYPEVSAAESVGHSHRLLSALAAGHPLRDAQREVLVSDDSPDVPLTTSGVFLERRLTRAAGEAGLTLPAFVDPLLVAAFQDPSAVEPETRLLDRIGEAFGLASPRSLAALEVEARELSELARRLDAYAKLWEGALDALREENLRSFRAIDTEWGPRLEPATLQALDAEGRRRESEALLHALVDFTERSRERHARLADLRWKADESEVARSRAEVRLGVVLRMRAQLLELAGRRYLASNGAAEERAALQRLAACEDLRLAVPAHATAPSGSQAAFPTLAEERRSFERVMPGWLGIRFRPPQAAERLGRELPPGAVVVVEVLPGSPAAEAGLEPGDILLGPPGEPFQERQAVREWTMRGTIGASHPLLVLRGDDEWEARIRLSAHPVERR